MAPQTQSPPRIYSYVRFSSQRQLEGDSLRRQNELIDRYVKQKGYVLDSEFRYVDIQPAFRGKNLREGRIRLFIEAIREGRVQEGSVLLLESLDRLTRLKPLEAQAIFLEIINAGVNIVTLTDGIEHSRDAPDELQLNNLLISATTLCRAHDESLMKSKRLKYAWEQKRRDLGSKLYTRRIPSWLKVNEKTKEIELVESKAETVREIFALCLKGNHAEGIAKILRDKGTPLVGGGKNWEHSYVSQTLRNIAVTGEFRPHIMEKGKRVPTGQAVKLYPEIVTKDDFNRVQFIMDARTKNKKGGRASQRSEHIFGRLLHCGYCGSRVYRSAKGRYYKGQSRRVLICRSAKNGTGCFYVGWEYDEFEKEFLKVAGELSTVLRGKYGFGPLREKIASLTAEQRDIQKRIGKLSDAVEITEQTPVQSRTLTNRIVALEKEQDAVTAKLKSAERELAARQDGPPPVVELEKLLKTMENEDVRKVVADIVCQLFDRIDVYPAGSRFSFAKLKQLHAVLVQKYGKPDGHVNARVRELFDRRKARYFQATLNMPGVKRRMTVTNGKNIFPTVRLDLVDDLPEDSEPEMKP